MYVWTCAVGRASCDGGGYGGSRPRAGKGAGAGAGEGAGARARAEAGAVAVAVYTVARGRREAARAVLEEKGEAAKVWVV